MAYKLLDFSHTKKDDLYNKLLNLAKKEITFDALWDYLEKKSLDDQKSQILTVFLPLDIDTQALHILQSNNKTDDVKEYIEEMLRSSKSNDYGNILSKATDILEKTTNIDTEKIQELINSISAFLAYLGELKEKTKCSNLSDDDVCKVFSWFGKDKDHKSFHDWYRNLDIAFDKFKNS
jgi:predicted transcriptional regulator